MDRHTIDMMGMNVAVALDKNALPQTCVLLYSLQKMNKPYPIDVYVLQSELDEDDIALLESVFCTDSSKIIHSIGIDNGAFSMLKTPLFWTAEAYYRLMLSDILTDIDRILYLDIDTLVIRDIYGFYHMPFEGNLMIAGRDTEFESSLEGDPDGVSPRTRLMRELKGQGMTYFCSGLMLLNLSELRKDYSFQRYIEIYETIKDCLVWPDQDLLNYCHWRQVKLIDESVYGMFALTAHRNGRTREDVLKKAAIIHYTTIHKPWRPAAYRYDLEQIWWDYARELPIYHKLLEHLLYASFEELAIEEEYKGLQKENAELKELLFRCQALIQKISQNG